MARSQQSAEPPRCALCDRADYDTLFLRTAGTIYGTVRLCNAHLAALNLGEWWLTVRLMDNVATVSGQSRRRLLQGEGEAQGGGGD